LEEEEESEDEDDEDESEESEMGGSLRFARVWKVGTLIRRFHSQEEKSMFKRGSR
jgi:hypothetical protein